MNGYNVYNDDLGVGPKHLAKVNMTEILLYPFGIRYPLYSCHGHSYS